MERRPVVAVTFALLMLASSVTMTGAAAAYGDSHDSLQPREQADAYPQFSTATSPISEHTANDSERQALPNVTDPHLGPHQRVAIANYTLHQIDGETGREERALSQARDEVASALKQYEAGRPTDEQAFHAKARALHALARASGGSNDATIRDVSEGLFLASNESARVAVLDANGSLQAYSTDLDRNERRFVERALRNAERGFDRADRAAERGGEDRSLRRAVRAKADAIDHYRSAYHHAERGKDRMERAVDPNLSLSQGQAFEQNDSVLVVLDAELTDVRPYTYDEASVAAVNGSANASTIRFGRPIAGSSLVSGSTIVELGPDAQNATVAVSATAPHDPDRQVTETIDLSVENVEVIPDPPDPDEYNEVEIRNETTGVTVEAGGDGLWEERMRVTNETPASDQAFRAAPVVRVESQTEVDNATIRIPIDESVPRSEYENLSIYTWNGSQGSQWHRVNTTIENGTAVAHVEHFSFFTILNDLSWQDAITETVQSGGASEGEPIEFEAARNFSCTGACNVTNDTTLVIGGTPQAESIVVEQGNETFEVVPMSNGQRIEEFYDYGNAHINSPLPIAESETSQLFFWSGPEGLSLVTLHDLPNDGSGGAVSFDFDGLPTDAGQWVVRDDPGDLGRNSASPDWRWWASKTDGGAFRGGLTNQSIQIEPAFNGEAEQPNNGQIEKWQFLTGQATDPESISLEMDQPVRIHVPEAPEENASDLEGDIGTATWNGTIADSATNLTLLYETEQTDENPRANLILRDSNGTTVRHDLTIGSVGAVQESIDISALGSDVEYRIHAAGVNTRIQVAPESSLTDSDGDGIPDTLEDRRWTMPDQSFQSITTEVHDPDTDGDGLNDGEEIHFDKVHTGSGIEYRIRASSNPARADSDKDGLSDRAEAGGWEIQYTDNREDSIAVLEALSESESDEIPDLDQHLRTESVTSNPLLADSNGDGLTDRDNRELGTDPRAADTTGDGVRDAEALADGNDPTLFDTRAPEIDVHQGDVWSDNWEVEVNYLARISAHDAARVEKIALLVDGEEVDSMDVSEINNPGVTLEGSGGALDNFAGFYQGQTLTVRVTDQNGNTREVVADQRETIFGKASLALQQEGLTGVVLAERLGAFQGFAAGAGETAGMVRAFFSNPVEYTKTLAKSLKAITNIEEIIETLPQAVEAKQHRQNPHEKGTDAYESYRFGWYRGYVGYLILETVVPASKAKDVLKNSQRVQQTFTKLDKGGDLTRAARYASKAHDKATAPRRLAGYHLMRGIRGSIGLSRGAAERVIGSGKTTAQKYRITEQLKRLDPREVERLSSREHTRLGEFFARFGDDGGRLVAADGGGNVIRLITETHGLQPTTKRRLVQAHSRGDLSDEDLLRIANGVEEGTIDRRSVSVGLERLNRLIEEDIIENPEIRIGSETNHRDPYYTVRYDEEFSRGQLVDGEVPDSHKPGNPKPGYDAPNKPNGLVIEADLSQPTTYFRAHKRNNREGTFLAPKGEFRKTAVEGGREGLESKYALQNGVPDYVTEVTVPEGETVRISTARSQDDLPGGGTQVEIRRFPGEVEDGWFGEPQELESIID